MWQLCPFVLVGLSPFHLFRPNFSLSGDVTLREYEKYFIMILSWRSGLLVHPLNVMFFCIPSQLFPGPKDERSKAESSEGTIRRQALVLTLALHCTARARSLARSSVPSLANQCENLKYPLLNGKWGGLLQLQLGLVRFTVTPAQILQKGRQVRCKRHAAESQFISSESKYSARWFSPS